MFPYPSGAGLHVGHPEGYTATDILARYKRMRGFNVLHPMGWDAFGLPAEQYAIETGTHPRVTTQKNIDTFRRQIKMLGFSYDWDREVDTTDPELLQVDAVDLPAAVRHLVRRRAAEGPADRRAADSRRRAGAGRRTPSARIRTASGWRIRPRCRSTGARRWARCWPTRKSSTASRERGGHPVVRMPLRQWMLRITAYAERLLDDLEPVDWPRRRSRRCSATGSAAAKGRRSISRSPSPTAAASCGDTIRVFTTRPDTLFGATYMVLAPEHPLVDADHDARADAPPSRRTRTRPPRKSDLERTELAKTKTGVFTGAYAINPVNGEKIPIWIADYVLASYGTGAIMAVPAHDERDFEFAKQFGLPIVRGRAAARRMAERGRSRTLERRLTEALRRDEGVAINSGQFDGLPTAEVKSEDHRLAGGATGWAQQTVNYKLRDWLFSRQRYWGEPFPILHELDAAGKPTGVDRSRCRSSELPLTLPELEDFKPTGKPGAAAGQGDRLGRTSRATARRYRRETNTMPQWAGSCWYYLRYLDPKNDQAFCDPAKAKHWMPVDLYVGGAEHAVLHLLYSRFWHKVLFDRGHVRTPEPFQRLVNQGMILGEMEYTGFQRAGGHVGLRRARRLRRRRGRCTRRPARSSIVVKLDGGRRSRRRATASCSRISRRSASTPAPTRCRRAAATSSTPTTSSSEYGADSLRLYEMFMGPLEAIKPWSMRGVEGVYRFLGRVWRLIDRRPRRGR